MCRPDTPRATIHLSLNSHIIHFVNRLSEIWTDKAAHHASLEPEDIQALIQQARPLIAGASDQTQLTVRGGKGLPD